MGSNSDAFFQPLLPDFLNNFSIPVAYLKKLEAELKGHQLESVVLMREKEGHTDKHDNKHWVVQIQGGRHFDPEDWNKFALHYQLKEGCFLVFRHSGNLLFHVSVFDPVTSCQCDSLSHPEEEEEERGGGGGGAAMPSRRGKHRPPPRCHVTITSYSAQKNIIGHKFLMMMWMQHLPRRFVRESGLAFRRCVVTLIDQKKRSWKVWLNYKDSDGQSYVNRGWKAFQDANPLKPGDVIRLQLLNPGKYPVFKCCICPKPWEEKDEEEEEEEEEEEKEEVEEEEEEEAEEEEEEEKEAAVLPCTRRPVRCTLPCCHLTISSYSACKNIVYLPRKFARENGLAFRQCVVTLIDQKKRSWKVSLNYKDCNGQSYINQGWKAFQVANSLEPGDVIMLQLLDAGKYPVFKCGTRPKPWERGGGGEDDNDGEDEDDDDDEAEKEAVVVPPRRRPGQHTPPTCHLTITSYSAGRNFVHLPKRFVEENGLACRSCDVTVIDEKRRSSQVKLHYSKCSGRSYIKQGWKAFQDANHLKPGDIVRLQLLSAGKYPVFKCWSR